MKNNIVLPINYTADPEEFIMSSMKLHRTYCNKYFTGLKRNGQLESPGDS